MKLKNLRLTLANVARTTNSKTMPVNEVGTVNKFDELGKKTDEIEYHYVECSAYRGDVLKVKFPATLTDKIEQLKADLENDVEIEISFTNLKLTPFALKADNGSVLSGVAGKADDFTVVTSVEDVMSDIVI